MSAEPLVIVYKATNLVNGKFYIGYSGRGLKKREKGHRADARAGKGNLLHAAMRKYGHENIVFEVMADFGDDEELAKLYECEAIAKYKPEYNLTYGGEGGTLHPDSRKKIGDANRGRKMPPSHGEKRRAYMTGRKLSAEHRAKIGAGQLGRTGWNKGRATSEETKQKLRAANKGQVPWIKGVGHSEETKAKIRAARWNHTPESLERISVSRRIAWENRTEAMLDAVRSAQKKALEKRRIKVRCEDDGLSFSGCSEADRFYGFRVGTVSRIVKGTIVNKTGKTFTRIEAAE